MADELLALQNISKSFYDLSVLSDISLSINKGESIALFGENGSGKTMLCNIISGNTKPDSGKIFFKGESIQLNSVEEGINHGIMMIHQDCQLIPELTVAENVFLNSTPNGIAKLGSLNRKKLFVDTADILKDIGSDIAPNVTANTLSMPDRKIVEIAKAPTINPELLIVDEVTEAFSSNDAQRILNLILKINKRGIAVILVSHHIDELQMLNWRTWIMKDGQIVEDAKKFKDLKRNYIYSKMAGERLLNRYPKTSHAKKERILTAVNLYNETGTVNDASLTLYRGEILGIYGMDGSGKSSLARMLCGVDKIISGEIVYYGQNIDLKKGDTLFNHGIGYLSDVIDRNIFFDLDTSTNIIIGKQSKASNSFTLSSQKIKSLSTHYSKSLNIPVSVARKKVRYLSRGTQQKVAIARLLNSDCSILIMDEPSSHLDIVSRVELYNIMNKLAQTGKGIIFASSQLEELAGMCDRLYIISKGHIVAEINPKECDLNNIMEYVC